MAKFYRTYGGALKRKKSHGGQIVSVSNGFRVTKSGSFKKKYKHSLRKGVF